MSCNCGVAKQIDKIYGDFGFKKAISSEEKIGYKIKVVLYAMISLFVKILSLPILVVGILIMYPFLKKNKVISIDKLFGLKRNKTLEEYVRNQQIIQDKD